MSGEAGLGAEAATAVPDAERLVWTARVGSDSSHARSAGPLATRLVDTLLNFVYYLTWVYPVFTLSKILNNIYYQEIADEAFAYLRGDTATEPRKQQGEYV